MSLITSIEALEADFAALKAKVEAFFSKTDTSVHADVADLKAHVEAVETKVSAVTAAIKAAA